MNIGEYATGQVEIERHAFTGFARSEITGISGTGSCKCGWHSAGAGNIAIIEYGEHVAESALRAAALG